MDTRIHTNNLCTYQSHAPLVGPGRDLTFLVDQMPHPGDDPYPSGGMGGGWVHGDLTFTPQNILFLHEYDYVETSNSPGVGHSFP